MKLYFDEDVSIKVAINLRNRGFYVLTTVEAQNLGATDEEQLSYAAKNGLVLVTHNLKHFMNLHSQYLQDEKFHSGIVLAVRQKDSYRTVKELLLLLQNTSPVEMRNQLRYA